MLLPSSPLKSQVPFTATLDALKAINPHVKYLESRYKVRRTFAVVSHVGMWTDTA